MGNVFPQKKSALFSFFLIIFVKILKIKGLQGLGPVLL